MIKRTYIIIRLFLFLLTVITITLLATISISYSGTHTITTITNISNYQTKDVRSRINDNGVVVWTGWDGNDYEIYPFNGSVSKLWRSSL